MSGTLTEKQEQELREAAPRVQQAWLDGIEKETEEIGAEPSEGFHERLGQAFREAQQIPEKPARRSVFRRPAVRIAAAFGLVLLVLAGWLAFDRTARAEAADWMKSVLGIESTSQDAYERLLRFLGGTPDRRDLYRDPKGEAWRPVFGGAWLNGDKELVVALTDDSPETVRVFRDVLQYEAVVFRKVKYSYDELYAVYETMNQKRTEAPLQGLSGYSIDLQNNQIEVSFAEEGEETWTRFLAWLGDAPADMFHFNNEYIWAVRDQEDQDLLELTLLLQSDLLSASRLTELGDVEAARTPAQALSPEMLEDIEEYMQYKADTTYEITILDKDTVEDGDLVRIAYRTYTKTQYLDPKEIELPCRCGGEPDPGLEAIQTSVTPGRKVGENYTIEYPDAPYLTDETVYCDITILYIYRAEPCELNDEFVRKYTEYSSVEEWREARIKERMKWMVPDAWDRVLEKLLPACRFELDEARIEEKAQKPEKAKSQIREYLLVQAIADHYGIRVTEEDVQAYIKNHQIYLYGLPRAAYTACEWRALRELVIEKMTSSAP